MFFLFLLIKKRLLFYADKSSWYKRWENNGWRLVSDRVGSAGCVNLNVSLLCIAGNLIVLLCL